MGMSSSQVRLGFLYSRKNDIGFELQHCSNQKMSLARDMQKVSLDYQNALSSKCLKWSNNGGVSYSDLSYSMLMRPGEANGNKPYMITNTNGKVVLDSKYSQYAKALSPDGKPFKWEPNSDLAIQVLSSISGINAENIKTELNIESEIAAAQKEVNHYQGMTNILKNACRKDANNENMIEMLKRYMDPGNTHTFSTGGTSWADAYSKGESEKANSYIDLGGTKEEAMAKLKTIYGEIKTKLGKCFIDNEEDFDIVCDHRYENVDGEFTDKGEMKTDVFYENGRYVLDAFGCFNALAGYLNTRLGNSNLGENKEKFIWYDVNMSVDEVKSQTYKNQIKNFTYYGGGQVPGNTIGQVWNNIKDAKQAAEDKLDAAIEKRNGNMSSAERTKMNFYNEIFSTIAEKGWVENDQVSDNNYLNQMLQNGSYVLTQLKGTDEYYDSNSIKKQHNIYESDIAANCPKIYQVSDNAAKEEALAEYEYQKTIINQKESRIDTRMEDLKTEQSAIQKMIQNVEKVRDDNIQRTFTVFS